MARRQSKKKVTKATKSRPRTVRLPHDDERWVDTLADTEKHPQGFSGVMTDAVRFYREHKDKQRQQLLESIG